MKLSFADIYRDGLSNMERPNDTQLTASCHFVGGFAKMVDSLLEYLGRKGTSVPLVA